MDANLNVDMQIQGDHLLEPAVWRGEDVTVSAVATEDGGGGGNAFFSVDPGLVLWTWVVLALTMLTLYRFAWKPILKALDERETRIRDSLAAAKDAETAAQTSQEESAKILAEARRQGESLVEEARKTAMTLRSKMEEDTRNSIKAMTEKAETAIRNQESAAKANLQLYSAELSLKIAGKLIGENLDSTKNEALAKKFLEELK